MKSMLIILGLSCYMLAFTSCATRVVTAAPATKVVVIQKVPAKHKVVVVKGKRYYAWNGNHYRKTRRGYVLVKL